MATERVEARAKIERADRQRQREEVGEHLLKRVDVVGQLMTELPSKNAYGFTVRNDKFRGESCRVVSTFLTQDDDVELPPILAGFLKKEQFDFDYGLGIHVFVPKSEDHFAECLNVRFNQDWSSIDIGAEVIDSAMNVWDRKWLTDERLAVAIEFVEMLEASREFLSHLVAHRQEMADRRAREVA